MPSSASAADDDDDEDFHPGLVAQYTAGHRTIDRIDHDVQFVWAARSPDARLPAGRFSAHWTGQILIRTEGKHAFHLYLQGEATVTLNGKPVVSGRRDAPGWVEGDAVAVEFGEQKIDIAYKKTGDDAILRLFWSSEGFPTEPVPPQLLFHEAARPELDLIERGRDLYMACRCPACHRRENETPAEPAPALTNVAASLDRAWLIDWLIAPHRQTPAARMPGFGFSRDEANAAAEFLRQLSAGNGADQLPEDTVEKS
ncbi:MAG: PA14 domain-containing protein, partial [Deltaproteobacteria bacterium]